MPQLDGKEYSYDKKGMSEYKKAMKKKRKKKMTPKDNLKIQNSYES